MQSIWQNKIIAPLHNVVTKIVKENKQTNATAAETTKLKKEIIFVIVFMYVFYLCILIFYMCLYWIFMQLFSICICIWNVPPVKRQPLVPTKAPLWQLLFCLFTQVWHILIGNFIEIYWYILIYIYWYILIYMIYIDIYWFILIGNFVLQKSDAYWLATWFQPKTYKI